MNLFYHHFGKGKPVIILHGLFGISDNWVTIGRALSEHFSIYIPDLRNHGRSPHAAAFSYYAMAEDIKSFCHHHKLDKVILAGHSMGGKVAMQFAIDYPEMLEKLVVIDISPAKKPARQIHVQIIHAMENVDFDICKTRQIVENQLTTDIPNKSLRMFIMKNLYRIDENRLGWRINLSAIVEQLDDIAVGIEPENKITAPVLFLRGEASDYITDEDEKLIYDIFSSVEIKKIPDASHWMHVDNPVAVKNAFLSFM
ncbi:MAG: alpha/beta fold hydrolase [Bacteroidales bacterium]|nr:alpha/beta fold hydrolase [Bacteroidales bacterium]